MHTTEAPKPEKSVSPAGAGSSGVSKKHICKIILIFNYANTKIYDETGTTTLSKSNSAFEVQPEPNKMIADQRYKN